jgi:hypothetical protein
VITVAKVPEGVVVLPPAPASFLASSVRSSDALSMMSVHLLPFSRQSLGTGAGA